jgi:anaerobic magnesium-protoporphyrin IX monomethyl ester cyclase
MLKIFLLSAPTETLQSYHQYYPLGIIYLASILRDMGHQVIVKDYFYNKEEKADTEFYRILEEFSPDIVGFSMWTMNRVASYKMANAIKRKYKNIKIITGGPHASYMYKQILEEFDFDFVVIGEGETTTKELVECIESKGDLSLVKGIAYKDRFNKMRINPQRDFLEDINTLPVPSHIDFKEKILASKEAYIMTSRGCPIGCIYCSTSHFWGKLWRARGAERVIEEIEYLVDTFPCLESIMFHDDAFTLDRKRTIDICRMMIERGIKINWNCQTRVNSLNQEVASWMKKAGCRHVYLGVESGSQNIINNIGKKITIEEIKRTAKILEDAGIPYGVYLMVGNPGENEETIEETIKLINELSPTNFNRPAILQIYPGTELYRMAKENGFITDGYWATDNKTPLYTKEIPLMQLKMWSNRIAFYSKRKKGLMFTLNSIIRFPLQHSLNDTVTVTRTLIKDYFVKKRRN